MCVFLYLFLALFIHRSVQVDQSKFNTCAQTSFCPRLRENTPGNLFVSGYDNLGNLLVNDGSKEHILRLQLVDGKVIFVNVRRNDVIHSVMEDFLPKRSHSSLTLMQPMSSKELHYYVTENYVVKVQIQPVSISIIKGDSIRVHMDSIILSQGSKKSEPLNSEEEQEEDVVKEESDFVHARLHFDSDGVLYGIPEHTGHLALKETTEGEPYRLYNLDVFEYELDSTMALYGSIPYLISHCSKGTIGVFWNNPSETWVDIKASNDVGIISETGNLEVFVMLGDNLDQVQQQYRDLTGPPPMPPLFALGYHQSRWNYNDEKDVLEVDNKFDSEDIPYDVIWLDIEHTHDKRYMTWDPVHFKTPKKLLQKLKQKNRQLVTIVDPHIKKDETYGIYKDLARKELLIKDSHGGVFEGHCWPGQSVWVDFVNEAARAEWSKTIQKYASQYPVLIWNDMNEPSVFSSAEITLPKDAQHTIKGDQRISHRLVHNLYGSLMHQATFEGLKKAKRNKRPFVLSRSFYAGSQRYGAIWTGDNKAEWSHLKASIPMLLSMSMCGLPFVGADVGGFFGNPEPELLVRWYQTGALYPFFRGHAHIETKRREPWVFGDPYTSLIRAAIKLRYSLLPYIYTLFYESHLTGKPVMRSVGQEFDSARYWKEERVFMLGSAFLHQPILQAKGEVELVLPRNSEEDNWYDYYTGKVVQEELKPVELADMILSVRGGSIIPIKENATKNSKAMQSEPYTIIIAPNQHGKAHGSLYLDDGESLNAKHSFFYFKYENRTLFIKAEILHFDKHCKICKIVLFRKGETPISKSIDLNFGKKATSIKLAD